MKKDVSLHYQKTNKMITEEEYQNRKFKPLMDIWNQIYMIQNNSEIWNYMNIKEKREYKKIEDKFFKLAKTLYYNDMLLQKSNTAEGTTTI